jgi:PPM family protein phosphatase
MSDSPFALKAAGKSDAGPVRRSNEDTLVLEPDVSLFAVADGMGGHNAGEIASRLAVESLSSFIRRSHEDSDFSWPYGIEPSLSYQANRLRTAINLANRRVFRAAESHDDYTGMGSTIAALLFGNNTVVIGHVGDSRAYLVRGADVTQLTQDDTWAVAMLAEDPTSDPAALASHPMKHVLTNVLGSKEHTDIHIAEHSLIAGDRLMLCSDGLHGVLAPADLQRVLAEVAPEAVEEAAARLVGAALQRGTRDNVTALVVYVAEAGE